MPIRATPEMKAAFKQRVDMWANSRRVFGSWDEFLKLARFNVHGKTKRIRKKRAKVIVAAIIRDDLIDFGMDLIRKG